MKKVAIGIGAVIAVIIVAAIVLPFLVPMERYKQEITERTREATGRDLVIAGPLSFRLFPSIGLTAEDVTFSNAPGGRAENMATLDTLRVSVKFLPLLSGNLEVDGFELVNPDIALEVDENGQGNWVLTDAAAQPDTPAPDSGPTDLSFLEGLSLDNVRLSDGHVSYYDARTGETMEVNDINASLALPAYNEALTADGSLRWNDETITLDARLASLQGFLEGQEENFGMEVSSAPISLTVDGTAKMADSPAASGTVDLDIPSIRDLAAWAGTPLEMPGSGLGPLAISGNLDYTEGRTAFSDANIALDDIRATGDVAFDTTGPRPKVTGRLDAQTLDLNPYMPPPAEDEPAEIVWSEAPIDASGLQAADMDFTISAQAIRVMDFQIGESALKLAVTDGVLTADLTEMALYGGSGSGTVELDGRQPALGMQADFSLSGVQAEPLLLDAADMDRLTGTLGTTFSVNASGRSQKALIGALDGNGEFAFKDGEIRGVDLAKIARTIESVVNGISDSGGDFLQTLTSGNIVGSLQSVGALFGASGEVDEATKFTSLGGSWTANDGVINNPDLALVGPRVNDRAVLRMSGQGDIDLPQQTLDYETEIRSFPQAETEENAGGIGGTVRLTGTLTEPNACVVIGSLCIGKETKPADIVKERLLGGGSSGDNGGGSPQDTVDSVTKGIRNLLGGD